MRKSHYLNILNSEVYELSGSLNQPTCTIWIQYSRNHHNVCSSDFVILKKGLQCHQTLSHTGFGAGDETTQGIAINQRNEKIVAEYREHRIAIFSPTLGSIERFGTGGKEDGQFNHPCGVAVDDDGNTSG